MGDLCDGAQQLKRALVPKMRSAKLARLLGVSRQAVISWLSGRSRPSADLRAAIEGALGIPAGSWLTAKEQEKVRGVRRAVERSSDED